MSSIASQDDLPPGEALRQQSLKAYSLATREAARVFRQTGNPRYLPAIVRGILERHASAAGAEKLRNSRLVFSLRDDLGIDSLTLIEVSIDLEYATGIAIERGELAQLCTTSGIERILCAKRGNVRPSPAAA